MTPTIWSNQQLIPTFGRLRVVWSDNNNDARQKTAAAAGISLALSANGNGCCYVAGPIGARRALLIYLYSVDLQPISFFDIS